VTHLPPPPPFLPENYSPLCSPKLNGKAERMNRTLREEFWAFYEDEDNLKEIRAALGKWTHEAYASPYHPG